MTPEERVFFAAKDASDIEAVRLRLLRQIELAGADGIQAEHIGGHWWKLASKHAPDDGVLRSGLADLFTPVFLRGDLPLGAQDVYPAQDEADIHILLAACSEGFDSFNARIELARKLRAEAQQSRSGAKRLPFLLSAPRVIPADEAELIFSMTGDHQD